jgi:hypothetical protein
LSYETNARTNISKFYDPVQLPGGYLFNHVDTLKLIDLYYNSKYKTGQYDVLGYRKFFYNIVKPACDIATKFIDLDTKDIILIPEGNDDELKVWFMQKKLKQWLKDTDFGSLLNEIAFDLPKYGSVVIKKGKKEWKKVNLQNLRFDTSVSSLKNSPYVYEVLSMARHEVDEMNWDTTDLYARGDDPTLLIYDCYERKGSKWKRIVYGDLYSSKKHGGINRAVESEINDKTDYYGSTILYEETVSELPYRELHWERVPGRWLGYGFVEYLEENQIATNEAENLERKGLMFTSLKLYQTRDESIGGSNILTSTQNGQILKIDSEITPISMEERNLGAFNNTRSNWVSNTERKTFTTDITTGANLPSRTPLGVANLQASLASSYFELKRENFGLFIKKLLIDDIIPSFVKENSKEHILMFAYSEQDLDLLDELIADITVGNAENDYAERTGFFPSTQQREQAKQQIKDSLRKNKNRYLTIAKDLYRNAKYFVDVLVTGEQIDNGAKSQIIQTLLTIIGQNPMALQNPVTKSLIFNLAGLGGISPADLGLMNQQSNDQQQQMQGQQGMQQQQGMQSGMGGSMAKPQPSVAGQVSSSSQVG